MTTKQKTKAKPKRKMGRPSKYSKRLADKICELMAEGMSLRSICDEIPGMPHVRTVFKWIRDKEDFRHQYAHAMDERLYRLCEDTIEIADNVVADKDEVAKARVRIAAREYYLSKMDPKRYGRREHVEVQPVGDKPMYIVNVNRANDQPKETDHDEQNEDRPGEVE